MIKVIATAAMSLVASAAKLLADKKSKPEPDWKVNERAREALKWVEKIRRETQGRRG